MRSGQPRPGQAVPIQLSEGLMRPPRMASSAATGSENSIALSAVTHTSMSNCGGDLETLLLVSTTSMRARAPASTLATIWTGTLATKMPSTNVHHLRPGGRAGSGRLGPDSVGRRSATSISGATASGMPGSKANRWQEELGGHFSRSRTLRQT